MESELPVSSAVTSPPKNMNTFLAIWGSQLISILGSGLTSFGLGVFIYNQTHQATPFAITVLFGSLPRVIFAPFAGALVDRWDRRKVMMLADGGDALTVLAVAAGFLTRRLEIWMVYLAAFISALCNTFQEPAYAASVVMLVPKEQLGRANGMIQAAQSVELLLSPILAGALFAWIGLGGIILIDFVTFLVAVGALLVVRIPQPAKSQPSGEGVRAFLKDAAFGWKYLKARPALFVLLWYFALVNFFLNMSGVLVPPMVLTWTNSVGLGVVEMVSGIGMLVGSILISAWGGFKRRRRSPPPPARPSSS
ncbi:MAG TPA: MFS transporter [Anaerolinea sp.]|nr:MFS transporter [Anaerolinea sp.]